MLIYDKIYGEFDITGVVEELILSEPVQRLKEIHQGGASYLINKEVIDFFMNPLGIYGGDRLAKVLKQALNKKIITKDDFLTTDDQLLHKIKASNDQEVVSLLGQIHPDVEVEVNEQEYDIHQKNKIRLINPSIWINNKFVSASDLSNYVKEMNEVALFKAEIGMYVKLVKS
ncbi:hypothetical protein NKR17_13965 [Priestia flexa]|uniref:hypothetical protein n=1 Tax=Priestia flexa TaxID=86664 RepID=UPI00099D5958|nr:hypothetical protein [Priestia flexa]AQX54175.1 hypothetical protein BC359_07525 [Priestia flexa]MCP1190157.1 hypothetical protein [Priestia flexa]